MRLRRLILREVRMTLLEPFETSFGRSSLRRILLVEAETDAATGWGEVTVGSNPFYSPETTDTAWLIIRDFVWPMLQDAEIASAAAVGAMLTRIRGHNMAKGGVEAALWDAEAHAKSVPLWKHLGGTREEIPCGVSIGIKDSVPELLDAIAKETAAGYQRIKIKIKPGWDANVVAQVREKFPRIRLMVDANSAYQLSDLPLFREMERFFLMMIEQPLGWDDIYSHVQLQKQLDTPICLDECIHSDEHALAAIETGACKIINMKLGRVGGHAAARRIHGLCQSRGIPVWCGGMLESGIGRAHNIALSTLANFSLPGDVSASRRYWSEDIIEPEVEITKQGTIRVPTGPGIGYSPRTDRIEKLTVRKEVLG